ncbi:RNA pseudouridine synthase [Massilia horti]|uniref:Dual-specificity RNA pseudouridine synthase RluF n=1 Tax=Massilia horti TaxID=2562153 RepID=A0A4Y9SLQ6_9BURK|nr:RNA pseudouridine synthase [Massilia horti]TFW27612.1 RNA-binding protein [Massilia horti]
MSDDEAIRLAKRVAAQVACSRAEAERYIAGGWVSVDGKVVEDPATRVTPAQEVALLPGATAVEPPPVTILLHKPPGFQAGGAEGQDALACVRADTLVRAGAGEQQFLKRHLARLTLATPLETNASGLVVYTQDFRVVRRLVEDSASVEQEFVVEVSGQVAEGGLALLNRGLTFQGRVMAPLKASWQSENRLRFAGKAIRPGQIEHMCRAVGLGVTSIKRIRIGRVPMASLPQGQWRYLQAFERF